MQSSELVAVQFDIHWEDKPANHAKILELLSRVEIIPGSLIVLPEMFDTGFSMNVAVTAQLEQRESEAFLRRLAIEKKSTVLAGVVGPLVGNQASNEAIAFSAAGEELTRYRKMQPFTVAGEDRFHGYGTQHRSFQWNGLQVAPFICYDLRFPEVFRPAVQAGAELLIVIACWPAMRSEHWVRLLQARAIENQAMAIGVNRCGTEPGLQFDGRSCGFDEQGRALFEADASEQVVKLPLTALNVRQWRTDFPALRDIRYS